LRIKVNIVTLHGYFVQDPVFIAPILCDHSMCMEPFVFSEVLFPSEVHQNISLIDLLYVVKQPHLGRLTRVGRQSKTQL
jgi:hypothetical protein